MGKIDYSLLQKIYNDAMELSKCEHDHGEISRDENGIYYFHCPDCGRRGMGDYHVAVKLGWITPDL